MTSFRDSIAAQTPSHAFARSSFCSASTCVEVRRHADGVDLRDSKQNEMAEHQPMISLSAPAFDRFLDVVAGQGTPASDDEIAIDHLTDGWVAFRSLKTGVTLRYDAEEYQAFVQGVHAGEFRPVLA